MQPTHAKWETCDAGHELPLVESIDEDRQVKTKFPRIPSILERNFLIADTYFVNPPVTSFGIPGPDGSVLDIGPPGMAATSESAGTAMPFDCRESLELARQSAMKWKSSWQGEGVDGARGRLRISYNQ